MLKEPDAVSAASKRRSQARLPYDPQEIKLLDVAWSRNREVMYLLSEYLLPDGRSVHVLHRGLTGARLSLLSDVDISVSLIGEYYLRASVDGLGLQLWLRSPLHDSVLTRMSGETLMLRCGTAGFKATYNDDGTAQVTVLTKVVEARKLEDLEKAADNLLEAIEIAKQLKNLPSLRSIGPELFLKPLRSLLAQEDEPANPVSIDLVYLTMLQALIGEYEEFLTRNLMLNSNKFCARFYLLVKLLLDSANIDIPAFPGLSAEPPATNDPKRM